MEPTVHALTEVAEDCPIPLLSRRRIFGEQMLFAHVHLAKGCIVAVHAHESEQIAYIVSGSVRWTIGGPGKERQLVVTGGNVVHLPSHFPHGVEALEDTVIVDILSPPGMMGVDSQDAHTVDA